MLTSFPAPVLSVTADAVKDLEGHEALTGLWTLFTKCKESLQDGRRLENISWRLWHRELAQVQAQAQARGQQRRSSSASATCLTAYQPLTPVSMTANRPENSGRSSPAPPELAGSALIPGGGIMLSTTDIVQSHAVSRVVVPGVHVSILGLPSPGADQVAATPDTFTSARPLVVKTGTTATRMEMESTNTILARSIKSHCVGRVIVEMLPNHLHIPKPRPSAMFSSMSFAEPPASPALSHTSRTSYEQSTTPTPISASHNSSPAQPTSHATPISLTCTSSNPSISRPASSCARAQATALSDTLPLQVPVVKLQWPPPSTTTIDDENGTNTASGNVTANTYPRVIVVNPTPHPTPPTTPTLGGRVTPINVSFGSTTANDVGRIQGSKSTHLLPPLPLVAAVPSRDSPVRLQDSDQVSEPSRPLMPGSEQSAAVSTSVGAPARSADLPDGANTSLGLPNTPSESRRFFLQHSPDDISPEGDDGHGQQGSNRDASFPASGGELVDGDRRDNPSSRHSSRARRSQPAVHSQGPTTSTGAKGKGYGSGVAEHGKSGSEYDDTGDEDARDKRSVSAATNNSSGRGRKSRMAATAGRTQVGRLKRAHSAKHGIGLQGHCHVVPMMQKRSAGQAGERRMPQHYSQQQQHRASFNIGSGSSGGSKSTQSTNAPMYVPAAYGPANGAANAQVQVPIKDSIPDVPIQLPSTLASEPTIKVPNTRNGSTPQNNTITDDSNASATRSTNAKYNQPNGMQQQQGRRTIVVATSEEEYETTDGSDSEWASEDIEEGGKDARSKDAGKPKQLQQQHHGGPDKAKCHGKSVGVVSKAAEEETRLREAALEAQRQRELFTKVPRRSYSNLNRTQSGLLSQLLNPNPGLVSPGHLDRTTRSSQDMVTVNLTMTQAAVHAQGQRHLHASQPSQIVPLQRSHNAFAAPPTRLSTSKSAVALPMAARVTAIGGSKSTASSVSKPATDENPGRNEKSGGGYRRKGRPQEEEMEDDSGEENEDDRIQVSRSVAQEKLQALMLRRSSSSQHRQRRRESEDGSIGGAKVQEDDHSVGTVTYTPGGPATMATPTPIPLGHPYNLPPPAPPMTPRTTRRRMLRTELSESMRRQLLWERQVSSTTNPAAAARRARLTMTTSEFPIHANAQADPNATATRGDVNGTDDREGRRRMLSRNWTWSDDYHLAGW